MPVYLPTQYRYVSGPCGFGKSHNLRHHIATNLGRSNHLYLANSKLLIKEMKAGLEQLGITPVVITSDQTKYVKKAAIEFFARASSAGNVLLMTQQAFAKEPFLMRKGGWAVYIDEVPQIDRLHSFRLPFNHHHISDHVELAAHSPSLARVVTKNSLKQVLDRARDDVSEKFRDFYTDVLATGMDVFVDMQSWTSALASAQTEDAQGLIYFISLMNPQALAGFAEVTILGANVEDSLLFHYLGRKIRFTPHPTMTPEPRPGFVPWRDRVTIKYLLEDDFSKFMAKKEVAPGRSLVQAMEALAAEAFKDVPFLWCVNNDREDEPGFGAPVFQAMTNGKQIPVISHGLNAFADYHNIYFGPAINREPRHFKMLSELGMPPDVVRKASTHEIAYQAVMRTSLRVPGSTEMVTAIVTDRGTALRLQELLQANSIEKLGNIDDGGKEKPFSQQERRLRKKATMILKELGGGRDLLRISFRTMDPRSISRSAQDPDAEADLHDIGWRAQPCDIIVTLHDDQYDTAHEDFAVARRSFLELKKDWKELHKTPYRSKEERRCYNLTYFGPRIPGQEGYRTQAGFVMATAMLLDVDGGNLSKDDALRIFWDDPAAPKIAFFMYSSFRCGPEDPEKEIHPNKFHIVFPLFSPVTSVADYKVIYKYLTDRIVNAGFDLKAAVIDANFSSGNQYFYIPGRNAEIDACHQFFVSRGCDRERDLFKFALRPEPIIEAAKLKPVGPTRPILDAVQAAQPALAQGDATGEDLQGKIQQVVAEFTKLTTGRRNPFYGLGWRLRRLGLDWDAVEQVLMRVAGGDPKLMRWLTENMVDYRTKKHRWMWAPANPAGDDDQG